MSERVSGRRAKRLAVRLQGRRILVLLRAKTGFPHARERVCIPVGHRCGDLDRRGGHFHSVQTSWMLVSRRGSFSGGPHPRHHRGFAVIDRLQSDPCHPAWRRILDRFRCRFGDFSADSYVSTPWTVGCQNTDKPSGQVTPNLTPMRPAEPTVPESSVVRTTTIVRKTKRSAQAWDSHRVPYEADTRRVSCTSVPHVCGIDRRSQQQEGINAACL